MTVRREFVVYLSSTLDDLREEREVALKTIAEIGVVKTTYRADERGAVQACTDDVRASHLYVGILGQRYGWVPGVAEGGDDQTSITELEYRACARAAGAPVPRLMFVKPPEAGIPAKWIDALSNKASADRMADFLARAGKDQVPYPFLTLDQLRAELRIRVREQADRFHRAESGGHALFEGEPWKHALFPVRVACVPGTDEAARSALAQHGAERIAPVELSPDAPDYLALLDEAVAGAQLVALLVTPASLARLTQGDKPAMVAAALATLRDRIGCAPLVALGVEPAALPAAWTALAAVLPLPAAALDGAEAPGSLAKLYDALRALDADLTLAPRLALPYLVLAPTLAEAQALADPQGDAFAGYASSTTRQVRRGEFARIAQASRRAEAGWPAGDYGAQRSDWRCFGPAGPSADELVRRAVARINGAPAGSRERRFLRTAQLVPRRVRLDEYLDDRWGSRRAVESLRDAACLFVVDELALLHPGLRAAADALLTGARTAVVSVTPCDPLHSRIDELLDELSYLRVGSLVTRFKNELDPRCEVALNNLGRVERWLRTTLPELAAGAEEQEVAPDLLHRMARELA
jgi:hypothetical protein